jgi:outer membrane lipoprotein SlyB
MNARPIVNLRALIGSLAVAACCAPALALAQSGYYEYRSAPTYEYRGAPTYSAPERTYAQPGDPSYQDYRHRPDAAARFHGTVESVEIVGRGGHSSGSGAALGAIAGGALGNQIGDNAAATIGGVIGGAVLGNEIEKRRQRGETQQVRVRMDDGSMQVFNQEAPEIRVGDRVRVERDGHLELA